MHLHTSLPERKLDSYIAGMTQKHYRVDIIEQTETTRQAMARNVGQKSNVSEAAMSKMTLEDKLTQKSNLVSNREIKSIYSKGTYNNIDKDTYEAQWVLAVARSDPSANRKIEPNCG